MPEDNVFNAVSRKIGRDETPGGRPGPDGVTPSGPKKHIEVEDSMAGGLELATRHLEQHLSSGEPPPPEAEAQFEKFGALIVQLGAPAGSGSVPAGAEQGGAPPLPPGPAPPGPVGAI